MKAVPFLVQTLRSGLQSMLEQQKTATSQINLFIKNRDVILKRGKYEGRHAQIQEYYFDHGKEYLRVFIYRVDGRTGFKGREKFIDDHHAEFIEFEDCEFV